MLGLTKSEIEDSIAPYAELYWDGSHLRFADRGSPSLAINLRVKEPHQLVYLARLVASLGYEESHFRSAHLWITSWGVWNPLEEAVAYRMLEQFRRSFGENVQYRLHPVIAAVEATKPPEPPV